MRSRCCMCVCVSVYPPIVARQRLGKSPLIVARQRLGKNAPIVARQQRGKTPVIFARQRLGRNLTAVMHTRATIEECRTRRFQCGPCRIKKSRRLVLPRTSCVLFKMVLRDCLGSNKQKPWEPQWRLSVFGGLLEPRTSRERSKGATHSSAM
jgi:hypothetical protein